ncbi:MAG: ABC transporter permease [Dehalococcoidia bacterium]|nr:ABC transporter permease [Dehalococcoidia bacterium]
MIGGSPAYLRSLDRVGVEAVLDDLPPTGKNLIVSNDAIPSRLSSVNAVTSDIDATSRATFGEIASDSRRALRSPYHRNIDPVTISEWSLARFVLMDGFADNVQFVSGEPPQTPANNRPGAASEIVAEAALVADAAEELGITTGDTLTLTLAFGASSAVDVFISGTFVPDDELGEFWMGFGGPILRPTVLPGFAGGVAGLFVTEEGFGAVALEAAATPMDAAWIVDLDRIGLAELNAGEIADRADRFEGRIDQDVPGSLVITGLDRAFRALERRSVFARIPMFLMATILLTIVAYYLLMAASVLADRRKDEIGSLRSRGISLTQMAKLYGLEAGILIGLPVVLGPLISVVLISQSGRIPPFDGITGGGTLPASLAWEQFSFSLLAGLAALVVLVVPIVLSGAGNIVVQLRNEARPTRSPFFQRYFLDAALLVLAGFLVWELSANGNEAIRVDEDGGLSTDPTLFFAPALTLSAVSLVFLRVFPPVVRGLAFFMARFGPAWAALAVWRLGRAPYFYAPVILLLTLASGLAVVAATLASTLEDSARERVLYDSGSDIHIEAARESLDKVEIAREFSSVREASAAMRVRGEIGTATRGFSFELLGVQADRFADIAWFRPDFAETGLTDLMGGISSGTAVEPLLLPDSATELGIWTQSDDDIRHLFLWATIRGGTGIAETITLGPVEPGGWRLQSASLEGIATPVELLSIKLFEPEGEDRATAGSILLDDVVAIDSATGERTIVVDFDRPDRWTPFPTSNGLDVVFKIAREAEDLRTGEISGSGVGSMTFGRGTDGGVRGIYRSASGGPLPVLVSSTLARNAGIALDFPFIARLSGGLTPLVAVQIVDYFPTMDPDTDQGFMVVDLDVFADFLELKGALPVDLIDELFIGAAPGSHDQALADVNSLLTAAARVDVRQEMQSESLVDPLSVAGWRGIGLLAGITTLIVVVLGYLTYLRAYAGKMNTEEAFVRSMGLSRGGYMAAAVIEHVFLGLVGILLGVISGLAVAGLAVGVSTRTSSGDEPLPPFNLATQWEPVLIGYVILCIIAGVALGLLTARYSRRALHEATRVDE